MKQLLLRVPEDLHSRITARARREGRSVNAVASEILDAAADADGPDRMTRLRAKATAMGIYRSVPREGPIQDRDEALAETRGIGPILDRLIAEDRGRLDRLS